jgi:tRNA G18 (ribose-2'-O)-methylase SpoU
MPAVELRLWCDGVENPANRERIEAAAHLLGGACVESREGRLIALENASDARSIYGRRPLRETVTLALGNERRGLSRATLAAAAETLVIPAQSRSVRTLNVAAAAGVAGGYVLRGSGEQARARHARKRLPAVLLSGADHVEVGSSLRSAAAFGLDEVFLEDVGASWFEGEHGRRREARAAARRHKNPLRVRPGSPAIAERFEEVVVVVADGDGTPLSRARLAHGGRQLVVIGAEAERVAASAADVRVVTLGLASGRPAPLRIVASIALAEIARQVGTVIAPAAPARRRAPRYEDELTTAVADDDGLWLDPETLLGY